MRKIVKARRQRLFATLGVAAALAAVAVPVALPATASAQKNTTWCNWVNNAWARAVMNGEVAAAENWSKIWAESYCY